MKIEPLDVVGISVCVIAIILSIIALVIGSVYVQACLLIPITVLLLTGWVICMIKSRKK